MNFLQGIKCATPDNLDACHNCKRSVCKYTVPPLLPSNLQPKTVERDFSQSVVLLCQAQGVPQPVLEWFFNGRTIASLSTGR